MKGKNWQVTLNEHYDGKNTPSYWLKLLHCNFLSTHPVNIFSVGNGGLGGLQGVKQGLLFLIKCLSILVITSAIGLELWHRFAAVSQRDAILALAPLLWIGRFALTAHLIEGIAAAIYALQHQKPALSCAAYTFLVGTVGLFELLAANHADKTVVETVPD